MNRRSLLTLFVFLVMALPLTAQAHRWQPHGPEGGEILSLLVDPLIPGTIYAGALGGQIFVSQDGGDTWRLHGAVPATRIESLTKGPARNAPLFINTERGLFLMQRGAGTLEKLFVEQTPIDRLAAHPHLPWTTYFLSSGKLHGKYFGQTEGPTDGSWHETGLPPDLDPVLTVVLLSSSSTSPAWILYTASRLGIHRKEGATWETSNTGLPSDFEALDIASTQGSPDQVWVALRHSSSRSTAVYKSDDRGRSWRPMSQDFLGATGHARLAIDPGHPEVVYLSLSTGIFRHEGNGSLWAPTASTPSPQALAVNGSGTVFAGTRNSLGGGLSTSRDRGRSWQEIKAGLAVAIDDLSPDPGHPGTLLAGSASRGVLGFDGTAWSQMSLPETAATSIVRDPVDPSILHALAGSPSAGMRIYRSTDAGRDWQPILEELGSALALAASPKARVLYLAQEQALGTVVYKSADGGQSWIAVNREVDALCSIRTLAAHPENENLLVGSCAQTRFPYIWPPSSIGIIRSTDGGATWAMASNPSNHSVKRLVFDPHDGRRGFAGTAGGLLRSTDFGATWSEVDGLEWLDVLSIAFSPVREGEILLGTALNGVKRSLDGGETWQPYDEGLPPLGVRTLAFDPADPTKIWAGTDAGLYSIENPLPCSPTATDLCLQGGRFRLRVDWQDFDGNTGTGKAVPLTDATGSFWFFSPGNLEMAAKVLDGRNANGHFWVFFGGLSTVRYTITATDTLTGVVRRYENPSGRLASFGDTSAFPAAGASLGAAQSSVPLSISKAADEPTRFTLHDGRFEVAVRWRLDDVANAGAGTGLQLSQDTAAFWFFGPENLELFLKILDGRAVNGRYWLFFGALSNVGFEITVTDTTTGARRIYDNPYGTFGSRVDVELF